MADEATVQTVSDDEPVEVAMNLAILEFEFLALVDLYLQIP